jgi:hypothetical protein
MKNYLLKSIENKMSIGIGLHYDELILNAKNNEKRYKRYMNINHDDKEILRVTLEFEMKITRFLRSVFWANKLYKKGNWLGENIWEINKKYFNRYKNFRKVLFDNIKNEKKKIFELENKNDLEDKDNTIINNVKKI